MSRPPEPYIRKHVHRWVIKGDVYVFVAWNDSYHITVRECEDCSPRLRQCVRTTELFDYPKPLRAIADVPWRELEPHEDSARRAQLKP